MENEGARELQQYLHGLPVQIDRGVFHNLLAIAARHASTQIMVEKAVDVMLAVDLVTMAGRDEFDAAYILSADGDYCPAVEAAARLGKARIRLLTCLRSSARLCGEGVHPAAFPLVRGLLLVAGRQT